MAEVAHVEFHYEVKRVKTYTFRHTVHVLNIYTVQYFKYFICYIYMYVCIFYKIYYTYVFTMLYLI